MLWLSHPHAFTLLMVEWQATLCPRMPSCLCYLLALGISYVVIASHARVTACTLCAMYSPLKRYNIILCSACTLSLSLNAELHILLLLSAFQPCLVYPDILGLLEASLS